MNVTLHEDGYPYKSIKCSHTHINTTNTADPHNNEVTSEDVSWPVCSAWHQFLLAVHHNNTLTIADDHNNTWVNTSIRSSTLNLLVTVNHLSSSCITQTPVWEVEGGIPKDIVVPHCADALHFSLQATTPVTPLLTVGNVSLPLSQLSPAQPRLRLTVKSTPGVAPRVVSVDVWRTVVEVGSASSTFSLSSPKDTFTLLQHLHLQEGQAETQDCRETVQVIFAESLEVLVMALEALHEEAKPLGLEVYWLKTKVQVFGRLLDETVQELNHRISTINSITFNSVWEAALLHGHHTALSMDGALCNTATCFFSEAKNTERLLAEKTLPPLVHRSLKNPAAHLPYHRPSARLIPEGIYEEIEGDLGTAGIP
ncbi:hypothetical protein GWK47_016112 [Chionoecetes opilio]|uniref:Uncharacterized protein n=1 Tax=Chionoecetes opilio TaxID=41210 RepID=A0A8J4XST0_CHIOP|nr:hypothetical protein GWK47_016112 [Chionoecetes opilio]